MRQGNSKAQTQSLERTSRERRRVSCEYEMRVGRGGGVVDLLTARRKGCPAGPMKEVESESPKITRPLAWLRDCPVQEVDGEGRS